MPDTAQGIPLDRVVAVVATLADGREQVGSGYLAGGRIVLTAEHCTRDKLRADDPRRPLRVYRATDRTSVDVVNVDACPALDVAVLYLAEAAPWPAGLSSPGYARVDRMHAGMLAGCQAIGYPEWQRDPQKGTRDHAELHGIIYQTDEAESGRLLMREPRISPGGIDAARAAGDDPQGAATPWGGLSGALVFYHGDAIGIVVEHHPRQGDSALRAIAFDTFARRALTDSEAAQIATALGLPAEEAMPYAVSSPEAPGVRTPGGLPVRRQAPPPSPPGTAVPRPRLAAAALSALRDGPSPLVALVGPGGFGKSVLAMQVAAQVDAQAESAGAEAWCPGGTVWLDIGQDPNLTRLLSECLAALTGVPGAGQSPEKLAGDLGVVLAGRRCLLVLDDVWPARRGQADVVDVVISRIANVPRLVTTRSAALLADAPGALPPIEVSEMSPDEAADVLAAAIPGQASEQDTTQLREFAQRLGYWPLLLHLAEGYLRQRVHRGAALRQALGDLADRYERKGVIAFDARDPVKRADAVAETVEASLGLLGPEERGRYRDLAVFPTGQSVPIHVIAGWWAPALDRDETEDLLTCLANYALLTLDWRTETVRLHDVLGTYLLPRDPEQVAALHRRLVENWGDPMEQDGYRTRWYAYHLDLAGESDRLYALITPAWQDHVLAVTGALSDVQDDVRRAAAHAARRHDLPQELRCWLIATSIVEYAETVPGPLLPVLTWLGEVNRALGYATLNQTSQGGLAMTDVVAVLARKDPGQALAVAEQMDDPMFRARALADVAGVLARTDIDRAVAIADQINDGTSIGLIRTRALAHVAAVVAGTDADRALAIADRIDSPDGQADALIGIAVKLAATDLDRALAIAGQFGVDWREDRALGRIAAALADQPSQALVAARGIGDPAAKARALTGVAAVLAKTDPGRADELGDEALAACDDIADAAAKTEALAGIGAVLAGRASAMASRAMAAADGIDDAKEKAKALIGIAGAVGGTAPDQALAAAARIDDPVAKAMALTGIAAALAAIDPGRCRQLAGQVLDLADTIDDPEGQARLQTDLAVALASTSPDQALVIAGQIGGPGNDRNLYDIVCAMARTDPDQALVIARRIESSWFKARAIAVVAATLVDTDPNRFGALAAEALAAARQLEPSWYQAWVFGAFATSVAGTDLDLALDAANRIDDREHEDQVLGNIAVELAERDADLASATAGRIGNPVSKAMALEGIAVTLAGRDPDLALATAARVDVRVREETLAGIVGALAETDPDRAVAIAEQIDDDDPWRKAQALAWVAAVLPATERERAGALVDRALELASHIDIDIPVYKAEALTGIAAALADVDPGRAGGLVGQVAEAADQIDPENRAQALADITTALAGHAHQLAGPVVDAAERIDDHDRKAEALIAIGSVLAEADPGRAAELVSQALDASDHPQLLAAAAVALARVDPGRAAPLLERILAAADHIPVPVQKEWALTVIANPLARHDPELAVATAERIADPEYRAQAFAHIAAVLSARDPRRARELTDHAAAAADQVDPGSRGQAFVDIAEILAHEDPRLALAAADRMDNLEAMARALARVATIRAERASDSGAAGCDGHLTGELLVRLRGIDPAFSKEAWWRLAQLAVILADSAPDRHDLVRAVLSAGW
jgi:hypothetical protein